MFTIEDMAAICKPHNDKLIAEGRVEALERELLYAYRCIENGFVYANFDFTVLRTRASNFLAEYEKRHPRAKD